jgi:hypothetical protein
MVKRTVRSSCLFPATLLVAAIVGVGLSRMAFASPQMNWMLGNWSYETDFESNATGSHPTTGHAKGTQIGHVIEIGPINGWAVQGKLHGFVRDSGVVTWTFVYTGRACGGFKETPAPATIDSTKKKMRVRISFLSGANCDSDFPLIATLYRD